MHPCRSSRSASQRPRCSHSADAAAQRGIANPWPIVARIAPIRGPSGPGRVGRRPAVEDERRAHLPQDVLAVGRKLDPAGTRTEVGRHLVSGKGRLVRRGELVDHDVAVRRVVRQRDLEDGPRGGGQPGRLRRPVRLRRDEELVALRGEGVRDQQPRLGHGHGDRGQGRRRLLGRGRDRALGRRDPAAAQRRDGSGREQDKGGQPCPTRPQRPERTRDPRPALQPGGQVIGRPPMRWNVEVVDGLAAIPSDVRREPVAVPRDSFALGELAPRRRRAGRAARRPLRPGRLRTRCVDVTAAGCGSAIAARCRGSPPRGRRNRAGSMESRRR